MWVFTKIGFFSAVLVDPTHAEKLELPKKNAPWMMVRGRVRDDLVNLLEAWYALHPMANRGQGLLVADEKAEILEWPGRDYPYRLIMPQAHWAKLIAALAEEIDYTNFKNRVSDIQGYARSSLYGQVWGVMNRAEDKIRWKEEDERKRRKNEGYYKGSLFDFDFDPLPLPPEQERLDDVIDRYADEEDGRRERSGRRRRRKNKKKRGS